MAYFVQTYCGREKGVYYVSMLIVPNSAAQMIYYVLVTTDRAVWWLFPGV